MCKLNDKNNKIYVHFNEEQKVFFSSPFSILNIGQLGDESSSAFCK